MRACIWMKCCVSTNVGTWKNWLTFEPDPDYSPNAGTGLLSPISYKRCNAEFYYVGKIPRMRIGRPSLQRRVVLKWFYSPRAVRTPLSEVGLHALYWVPFYSYSTLYVKLIPCWVLTLSDFGRSWTDVQCHEDYTNFVNYYHWIVL